MKASANGIRFLSFSSGSSGNCYYLGNNDGGILIDAGVGIRNVKAHLAKIGLGFDKIHGVLITHDHFDHIRCLGSYCKRLAKPIWMTQKLHNALIKHYNTGLHLKQVVKLLPESGPAEIVEGRIFATPFVVPHDATQTLAYSIEIDGYKFVIMTDIGSMTDEAINYAKEASTVVVEANYDLNMLRCGHYPKDLQDRICGGSGHLSNEECADAIRDFMHKGHRNIFLCHLSANNNTPELALQAVSKVVKGKGIRLETLPRTSVSDFYEL